MDEQTKSLLYAVILSSGGWIALFISLWRSRHENRKDDATAANLISESATQLVKPLNDEINKLKARVTELEKQVERQEDELHKWSVGTKKLTKQIIEAGLTPRWSPIGIVEEK